MTLSIITITFNNPLELQRTLLSVPDHDYIEQVIVNGGTPISIAERTENKKVIIINEKDSGIADAFNKGTNAASGNALIYLNSGDTLINPKYLKEALNILKEKKEISFVHSSIIFADELGGELIIKPRMQNEGRGMKYLHPSMIIKREMFDSVKGYDTRYKIAMDFDFIIRAEQQGYKGFYLDGQPVVRMEGGGKSQRKEYDAIKECYRSLKENRLLILKNAAGLITRISLFYLRKILLSSGGGNLLGKMKRIKYAAKH